MPAADQQFTFRCPGCGYKARIPAGYRDTTILCPGCRSPQEAKAAPPGPATGGTASLARVSMVAPKPGSAPVARPAPAPIELHCTSCQAHVRIPGHYRGKTILCPRCNTPQVAVDAAMPPRPMDTTRALRGSGDELAPPPTVEPRLAERSRSDAVDPEPAAAQPATDSALTRAAQRRPGTEPGTRPGGRRRGGRRQSSDGLAAAPAPAPGRGSWLLPTLLGLAVILAGIGWWRSTQQIQALQAEIQRLQARPADQ